MVHLLEDISILENPTHRPYPTAHPHPRLHSYCSHISHILYIRFNVNIISCIKLAVSHTSSLSATLHTASRILLYLDLCLLLPLNIYLLPSLNIYLLPPLNIWLLPLLKMTAQGPLSALEMLQSLHHQLPNCSPPTFSTVFRFITLASGLKDNIILMQATSHHPDSAPLVLSPAIKLFLAGSCDISESDVDIYWKVLRNVVWHGDGGASSHVDMSLFAHHGWQHGISEWCC